MKPREVWSEAQKAGHAAAQAKLKELQRAGPRWEVVTRENPFDSDSEVVESHGHMLDLCGFAWVHLFKCNRKPTSTLVRFLKAKGAAYKSGRGGYTVSINTRRQEISVNEAAMSAVAEVLQAHGIEAYMQSRVD